jgi:hypothetical protein
VLTETEYQVSQVESQTPKILGVPDAETWKAFESNARKEWRKHHKKRSGKKSVAKEALALIIESWLELRHGKMTQYGIAKDAWKKNKKFSYRTYKKYTFEFVTELAIMGERHQLSENDKKLIEKATPALARKVDAVKEAHKNATTSDEGLRVSPHHDLAKNSQKR